MRKMRAIVLAVGSVVALSTAPVPQAQAAQFSADGVLARHCPSSYYAEHGTVWNILCERLDDGFNEYAAISECMDGSHRVGEYRRAGQWASVYCPSGHRRPDIHQRR